MNIYGSIREKDGVISFVIGAGKDTMSMQLDLGKIILHTETFQSFREVTAREYIKSKDDFNGLKRPIMIFTFNDKQQLDSFLKKYEIVPEEFSKLSYFQKLMKLEDDIIKEQDVDQIISMEEIASGKRSKKNTIGAIHNLEKYDPWDTMTEKEKAQSLLDNSAHYNELVEKGIFTDEAMAPAIVNNHEHEKLPIITMDNIPSELMEDFKKQGLHKFEIEKKLKEINDGIIEHNKMIDEGTYDEYISRVVGDIVDEKGTISGKIHINMEKNNNINKTTNEVIEKSSMSEEILKNSISEDDAKFLLTKNTIDGKYISDIETYIYDNTFIDMYDLQNAITQYTKKVESESFSLPDNFQNCNFENKEMILINANKVSDEDDLIFVCDIDVTDNSEITGTNNIDIMTIYNGAFVYIIKNIKNDVYVSTTDKVYKINANK